jgi:hypothetical protein
MQNFAKFLKPWFYFHMTLEFGIFKSSKFIKVVATYISAFYHLIRIKAIYNARIIHTGHELEPAWTMTSERKMVSTYSKIGSGVFPNLQNVKNVVWTKGKMKHQHWREIRGHTYTIKTLQSKYESSKNCTGIIFFLPLCDFFLSWASSIVICLLYRVLKTQYPIAVGRAKNMNKFNDGNDGWKEGSRRGKRGDKGLVSILDAG